MTAFNTDILYNHDLDYWGHLSELFDFYYECWDYVKKGKLPRFDICNKMPQLYYQHYLLPLDSFTIAEETVIANTYPVVKILKLRPNNKFNLRLNRDVWGHFALLQQNPSLLFNLLPLEITFIDHVIQVVLTDKTSPQPKQLS